MQDVNVPISRTNGLKAIDTDKLDAEIRAVLPHVVGVSAVSSTALADDPAMREAWRRGLCSSNYSPRGRLTSITVHFASAPPLNAIEVIARIIREHRVKD